MDMSMVAVSTSPITHVLECWDRPPGSVLNINVVWMRKFSVKTHKYQRLIVIVKETLFRVGIVCVSKLYIVLLKNR